MRKIRSCALIIGLVIGFPFGAVVQGFEVYSKNGQVYRASQYKIFENSMIISLKAGRPQKLPLHEVDWNNTLGDENVFQLVDTDLVYIRNGMVIPSKCYIVRHDEIVEVVTQEEKVLKYDRSEIDFEKIAVHLMKKKMKYQEEAHEEEQKTTMSENLVSEPVTEGEIYCGDNIVIPSQENPHIQFRFDVTTLKDTKLDNLFLNVVTIKAAAKNLSDRVSRLSYEDFTLITDEGVKVKPDSSLDNNFSIGRLAKNAMTFGTIRFSFTANNSTGSAKYLIYQGSYGKFVCLLQ